MDIKIPTSTQLDEMNDKLQNIEDKLNGVLDTQLTGSNLKKLEQQDLMYEIVVPANSFYNLDDVITMIRTPNVAFTIELDIAVKCRVYTYPRTASQENKRTLTKGSSRTIFSLDGSVDNAEALTQILHEYNTIYFQNQSASDVTVMTLTMTEHFI